MKEEGLPMRTADVTRLSSSGMERTRVRGLILNVTTRCNMVCEGCYGHLNLFESMDMDLRTARQAAELFFKNRIGPGERASHESIVMFWGGEPLMNLELIRECIRFLAEDYPAETLDYRLALCTNGTLLTPSLADYFFENGVEIFISFDGPYDIQRLRRNVTEKQYSHVSEMVRYCSRVNPKGFSTYTVVKEANLSRMEIVLNTLYEAGVRRAAITKDLLEYFWRDESPDLLYEILETFKKRHSDFSLLIYPEILGGCADCSPMYMMVYPNREVWDCCYAIATSVLQGGGIGVEDLEAFRFGSLDELDFLDLDVGRKRRLIRANLRCPTLQPTYEGRILKLL